MFVGGGGRAGKAAAFAVALACLCAAPAPALAEETYPGAALSFGVRHYHSLNSSWQWLSGADADFNAARKDKFDSSRLSAFTGPRWRAPTQNIALLFYWRRFFDHNHRHERDEPELRLLASRRFFDRRLALIALAAGKRINYCGGCSRSGEGVGGRLALRARWAFSSAVAAELATGIERVRAKKETLRSHVLPVDGGFIFTPSDGLKIAVNYRWEEKTFDASPNKRILRTAKISASSQNAKIKGFVPRLTLARDRATANYASDNYKRLRLELRFVRQFDGGR